LVWSVNPSMTNVQVRNFLISTAQQPDPSLPNPNNYYGFGRIDAANAVRAAANLTPLAPPVVTIQSPAPGATVAGTLPVTVSATDNVSVSSVTLIVDSTRLHDPVAAPPLYTFSVNTLQLVNGTHNITVTARDAAGLIGVSSPLSVTVNNTPTVIIR